MKKPSSFKIPFNFAERVPILQGSVNGRPFERFLLDTGAPSSCLHKDTTSSIGLLLPDSGFVRVDSFKFDGVDFGPLDMKVTEFSENRIDGLLGTKEIRAYCVTFNFRKSVLMFDKIGQKNPQGSNLEIFHGRPVIHIEYAGKMLRFVLDTGSSSSWLFISGQEKLSKIGKILDGAEEAKSAHTTWKVSKSKIFDKISIGGIQRDNIKFLLASPSDFGGSNTSEDGIIGIGSFDCELAVIDFLSSQFLLRGNKTTT